MIDIAKGRFWDLPWFLVDGCSPCSPGCARCWSAAMAHRFIREGEPGHTNGVITDEFGGFNGVIIVRPERLNIPLKRKKPTVYAVWNDLFHDQVTFEFVLAALTHAVGRYELHKYLILTKRHARMVEFFKWMETDAPYRVEIRDCFYFGLTVCTQQEADEKIPIFLQVPGKKFLSIEPMLGPIDLRIAAFNGADSFSAMAGINAVILGGESGPGARPMHPDWVRSVRKQCAAAGVPFFFKGWGKHVPSVKELIEPGASEYYRSVFYTTFRGQRAGRLLDGRTHDDLPWVKP